ncbi:MAG TPA: phenylalanine--tRNA ligase subunit alpha [Sediminispirochaeta sp.]|nr:phenylalanine--tRNA ligase subunit alpha [Sediminispirochaeta sp.]
MDLDVKSLHPLEVKTLRHVKPGEEFDTERLVMELSFNIGQCNQAFSWLAAKGFIEEARRSERVVYELTELGRSYAEKGTPEERIVEVLEQEGPMKMPELARRLGLENRDVGSAYGQLSKEGVLSMDAEKNVSSTGEGASERMKTVRSLLERAQKNGELEGSDLSSEEQQAIGKISKKRGASGVPFKTADREEIVYRLSPNGAAAREALIAAGMTGEEIGALSPELLSTGAWKNKSFRAYNIQSPPNRVLLGRRNPYGEYLHWVKDKLSSLGFEEFDGPLVETEFWNGDALFMPQFHSARDIHDVYYVKNPSHAKEIEQPYLDQVAAAHENGWTTGSRGWGYSFDRNFTRRQVLRSQGTVLSAKQLPQAKVPGKYFGVVRCFRYDQVDATQGADFYQTEGIVLGEEVNLRTLLGLLKMFAEEIAGAEEVKYVPGYFPFTEPSIEVHIKHPELGWFELGGSGIFRPEVSKSLGVDVPVLAWGLGIDRMALMHLGLNDLRELFSPNIENVRLRRNQ